MARSDWLFELADAQPQRLCGAGFPSQLELFGEVGDVELLLLLIILIYKGRAKLKDQIREAKLKRAEKELMEEEEEEERRQRQKKEEEEFTRIPDDTTNLNHYDMRDTTNPGMTQDGLLAGEGKGKKAPVPMSQS